MPDYLGQAGFGPQLSARPRKRVLQRRILNELSKEIFPGQVSKNTMVEAMGFLFYLRLNNLITSYL